MNTSGSSGYRLTSYLLALIMAAATVLAVSCAATDNSKVYLKDGKRYGVVSGTFRHRWWNYYERGLSYLSGGYNEDAARDLQAALEQRDEDQRRARTYGLHFTDYFPHRELGIAYLGMGKVDEAVRELETSLSQEESAKAKFYLNNARAGRLKASVASWALPGVSFDNLPETVNSSAVLVSGVATSPAYISSLSINGEPEFVELSDKNINFKREVGLSEGENKITVVTSDLLGRVAVEHITVTSDTHGPTMSVDDTGGYVKAFATDGSGITAMRLNGKDVPFEMSGDTAVFDLGLTALATINIEAEDGAGNVTTAELGLGGPDRPDDMPWPDFGSSWFGPDTPVKYEMVAANGDSTLVAANRGPVIKLKGLTDSQEVYFNSVYVEGYAAGRSRVTGVYIDGEPVSGAEGKKVFFGFLVPLAVGENVIELEAEDEDGNVARRNVKVIRIEQSVHAMSEKLSLSALPFDNGGLSDMAYDAFMDSLVGLDRFKVVERALLEEILMEQELSQTELADPSTAARLGRLVSAEGVVVGSYKEMDNSVEIYCRYVDTETSEVIEALDVYGEDKSLMGVASLMEGLAVKFRNSFPRVEGTVIKTEGNAVMVDIGDSAPLGKNYMFVVFREGEPVVHPKTGKKLGSPTELVGKARLKTAYSDFSECELVQVQKGEKPSSKDMVMTR